MILIGWSRVGPLPLFRDKVKVTFCVHYESTAERMRSKNITQYNVGVIYTFLIYSSNAIQHSTYIMIQKTMTIIKKSQFLYQSLPLCRHVSFFVTGYKLTDWKESHCFGCRYHHCVMVVTYSHIAWLRPYTYWSWIVVANHSDIVGCVMPRYRDSWELQYVKNFDEITLCKVGKLVATTARKQAFSLTTRTKLVDYFLKEVGIQTLCGYRKLIKILRDFDRR